MRTFLIPALLWVTLATAAQARDCNSESLTQAAMNECAGANAKTADAELNAKYRKIVACLKGEAKTLTEAQRAWIQFRDAECKFQGSASDGGSVHPFAVLTCITNVTAQRSKDLDYYLTCQEGDVSCPTSQCGFRDDKHSR